MPDTVSPLVVSDKVSGTIKLSPCIMKSDITYYRDFKHCIPYCDQFGDACIQFDFVVSKHGPHISTIWFDDISDIEQNSITHFQ